MVPSWNDGRFVGGGFAQSMLLHGAPNVAYGIDSDRVPVRRLAGPFRRRGVPGAISLWRTRRQAFEFRWADGGLRGQVGFRSVVELLGELDPGKNDLEADEQDTVRASWVRAAARIERFGIRVPGDLDVTYDIEERPLPTGEIASFYTDHHPRSAGVRRVPRRQRAIPVIALLAIVEHQSEFNAALLKLIRSDEATTDG